LLHVVDSPLIEYIPFMDLVIYITIAGFYERLMKDVLEFCKVFCKIV